MKTYLRLLGFARPFGPTAVGYFICALLGVLFGLLNVGLLIPILQVIFSTETVTQATPDPGAFHFSLDYLGDWFNFHFRGYAQKHGKMGALEFVCVALVCSVFLANLFVYLSQRIMAAARARLVYNVRETLYEKLTGMHVGFFSNERKGDLTARMTSDVQEIEQNVMSTLTVVFKDPIQIIATFIFLFTISAKLTFFCLLFFPISGTIVAVITRKLKKDARRSQVHLGNLLGVVDETLSGIRILKIFGAGGLVKNKFLRINGDYRTTLRAQLFKRDLASPLSQFMGVCIAAGLLYYGGTLVLSPGSEMEGPEFIAYIALFAQILSPAKAISTAISNIQRGLAAGERVFEIIDTPTLVTDKPGARKVEGFQTSVRLDNVSFAYEEKPVLEHVTLEIPKGQTVALVGPSGAGKSTMMDLVARFYDPDQGIVTIDGQDMRDLDSTSLHALMGLVTQEAILFNDTIAQNIAFGLNASQAQIEEAARIANAHNFILETESGYQTMIGDRGMKLSGGQRQRLTIARAVLHNPPILLLDEATSALDSESEKLVQQALTGLMAGRTTLVIAHRLSTIQHAHQIVVMDQGRILEQGTHKELLEKGGLYTKLSQMQQTK